MNWSLFWFHPPQESPNLSFWQQLAEAIETTPGEERSHQPWQQLMCWQAPTEAILCGPNSHLDMHAFCWVPGFASVSGVCPGKALSQNAMESWGHVFLSYSHLHTYELHTVQWNKYLARSEGNQVWMPGAAPVVGRDLWLSCPSASSSVHFCSPLIFPSYTSFIVF